jgi:hypothetical protein
VKQLSRKKQDYQTGSGTTARQSKTHVGTAASSFQRAMGADSALLPRRQPAQYNLLLGNQRLQMQSAGREHRQTKDKQSCSSLHPGQENLFPVTWPSL